MKAAFVLVCLFLIAAPAFTQQKEFQWRLGFSGGYATYHGDLTPRKVSGLSDQKAIQNIFTFNDNYVPTPSFRISLERQLSPSTGLSLHFGHYYFGMSDRYEETDGTLLLENPNFARSLNFENRTREVGIGLTIRPDNDKILSSNSIIAPYLSVGIGFMHFDVWGDLLDESGEKYDNTVLAIIHDGNHETYLPEWETELDGGYRQFTLNTQLGLGFRIKTSKRSEFFAQSTFMYTFSDFLDDVSGRYREEYSSSFQAYASKPGFNVVDPDFPYRGNPDGAKDWIFFHGFGLRYNFGAAKKNFRGPRLSSSYQPNDYPMIIEPATSQRSNLEARPVSDGAGWRGLPAQQIWEDIQRMDTLKYQNQLLAWNQEIQKRENYLITGREREKTLVQINTKAEQQYQELMAENRLSAEDKESFLRSSEISRFNLRYSLDSVRRKEQQYINEIDSIELLINDLRLKPTVLLIYLDSAQSTLERDPGQSTRKNDPTEEKREDESEDNIEEQPSSSMVTDSVDSSQMVSYSKDLDRVKALEEENKYLESERNRLLAEATETKKDPKAKQKKPKSTTRNKKSVRRSEKEVAREDESRRERRRRLAAAGVAAGTVAVIASNGDKEESDEVEATTTSKGQEPPEQPINPDNAQNRTPNQENPAPTVLPVPVALPPVAVPSAQNIITDQPEPRVEKKIAGDYFRHVETVYFESNQKIPNNSETDKLRELAEFVHTYKGYGLMLTGFTDNTGSLSYNLKLAEDRMVNVAGALENEYGIPKDLIRYQSGGKVLRGTQKANSPQDRKVEVSLILLEEDED